jgi:hypothetical protein
MEPVTIALLASAAVGAAKSLFGKKPESAPAPAGNSYADLQAMEKPNPLAAAGAQIGQQTAAPFQPLPVTPQAAPSPVALGAQPQDPLERLRQLQNPAGI